jgi:hypothetical protein
MATRLRGAYGTLYGVLEPGRNMKMKAGGRIRVRDFTERRESELDRAVVG